MTHLLQTCSRLIVAFAFGMVTAERAFGADGELLLPELLKQKGYATAILGTWHLGTVAEFLPLSNGFDEFLGIPYSNDNTKYHPVLHASMATRLKNSIGQWEKSLMH